MTRAAGASFVAVGTTTPEEVFRAAGVERVWSGVGAWTDDLLGSGGGTRSTGRGDPRTGPSGTVANPGAGDSIGG
jgi:hypothetical protein